MTNEPKKIPDDVKAALLALFGEKTVLEENAEHIFVFNDPYDPGLYRTITDLGITDDCNVARTKNGGTRVSLPDSEMAYLSNTLHRTKAREGDSGVISQMLYQYRSNKGLVYISIAKGNQEDNIRTINTHFRFLEGNGIQMPDASTNPPEVKVGLAAYKTLLMAWHKIAPDNIADRSNPNISLMGGSWKRKVVDAEPFGVAESNPPRSSAASATISPEEPPSGAKSWKDGGVVVNLDAFRRRNGGHEK